MTHCAWPPTASPPPSATETAGPSASSRSGAAGSCTSSAGSTTRGAILDGQFSPETGDRFIGALDAAGIVALGRVALHQGDGRLQQRTARLARGLLEDATPNFRRQAAWLLALQAMASGDPAAAHACLCALGEDQRTAILPLFPIDVTDEPQLVRIALAAGDDELAEVAAAQAGRRAQLNPAVATIVATAAHVLGLLRANIDDLERAVGLFASGPRPLARASALEDLGVARARAGAVDAAIEALDAALVLYAEAGPAGTWVVSEAGSATMASADASSRASVPTRAGVR